LAGTFGVPLLDKDTIKSTLLAMTADSALASRASYELLLPLAGDMLRLGMTVILDAPGKYPQFIEACQHEATACGVPFLPILCHAHVDIRRERLLRRDAMASQWASIPEGTSDTLDAWKTVFPDNALVQETAEHPDRLVQGVAAWLGWVQAGPGAGPRGL
jgi:predicted kinase